jgi:hypothetical protein
MSAPIRMGLGLLLGASAGASAQEKLGRISGSVGGQDAVVMVSCIKDGKIFSQGETKTGYNLGCPPSAAGIYEVRVEGDGIITEVKRGLHVFDGQTTSIRFEVKRGTGVHIVEYATGGLSREEVAAQLSDHSAELAVLQAQLVQTGRVRAPAATDPPCCTVIDVDEANLLGTARVNGFARTFRFKFQSPAQLLAVKNRATPTDARTSGTVKWFNDSRGSIWSFAAQGKIGFTPADPCCEIISRP